MNPLARQLWNKKMGDSSKNALFGNRAINSGEANFVVVGGNRSLLYAAKCLEQTGNSVRGALSLDDARAIVPKPLAILVAGDAYCEVSTEKAESPTEIYLWDFEVGCSGVGAFASAVSGVSAVIGHANSAPGLLPAHMPEKWVGMFAASLALSLSFMKNSGGVEFPRRLDVSAADILRAFAEQNSGNHAGVPYGWRRNGLTAVEHGGVFPQGFFRCRDGHVAIQARSRQDWQAIISALGSPIWASESEFQNPFKLSEDDSKILPLLDSELLKLDRKNILERAVECGAPMAPVLTFEEAVEWQIFRPGFIDESGLPLLPYILTYETISENYKG
jgi:hypothetical protein